MGNICIDIYMYVSEALWSYWEDLSISVRLKIAHMIIHVHYNVLSAEGVDSIGTESN